MLFHNSSIPSSRSQNSTNPNTVLSDPFRNIRILTQEISAQPEYLPNVLKIIEAVPRPLATQLLERFSALLSAIPPTQLPPYLPIAKKIAGDNSVDPTVCTLTSPVFPPRSQYSLTEAGSNLGSQGTRQENEPLLERIVAHRERHFIHLQRSASSPPADGRLCISWRAAPVHCGQLCRSR